MQTSKRSNSKKAGFYIAFIKLPQAGTKLHSCNNKNDFEVYASRTVVSNLGIANPKWVVFLFSKGYESFSFAIYNIIRKNNIHIYCFKNFNNR